MLPRLDDILGHASTPAGLTDVLEHILAFCELYGLNLHPGKCCFFTEDASWCGKMISASGVRHNPDRIVGLVSMTSPRTAADLQQFICTVNWIRNSIPNYNAQVAVLHALLEAAMKQAESRKKSQLQRVLLSSVGWTTAHDSALGRVKDVLLSMVPFAHPQEDAEVCMFTDASDAYRGAVCLQTQAIRTGEQW